MNILIWMIYIIFMMIFTISSIYLCAKITKKYKLNRWFIGFLAPSILIFPAIFLKNINSNVWTILTIISIILCILFFEINREIYESKKMKKAIKCKKN